MGVGLGAGAAMAQAMIGQVGAGQGLPGAGAQWRGCADCDGSEVLHRVRQADSGGIEVLP